MGAADGMNEIHAKAWRFREIGMTYPEIAARLGRHKEIVRGMVAKVNRKLGYRGMARQAKNDANGSTPSL